jgi:linearmycin/streptolysin S transport system permease protein
MSILTITRKDLLLFVKDRGRLFMAFLLPLVFILAFGYAYTQLAANAVRLVDLPVVNLDSGGAMSQALLDGLSPERGVRVKVYEEAEAESLLAKGDVGFVLTIPVGFSQAVDSGQQVTLVLVNHPDANESDVAAVQTVIEGVAADLSLQTQLVAAFRQMGQMQGTTPQGEQAFNSDAAINQAKSQFERAKTAPLVAVEQKVPDKILAERAEAPNAMEIAVPGFTVLFLFLSAGTTALAIYSEKKLGTFRRLLSAPLSKAEILPGKMLPNVVIVLLQVVVIFGVGAWVMPLLGLDSISLGNLPALAVVSILVALCSTGLGVFIAAVARTESQIGGIATVVLWVAGAAAGAFIPQFLLGDFLSAVGKLTPHYWAISAYSDVIVRGQNLAGVTTQLGILAVFTVVFFAIGLWRFKFDV